MSGARCPGALVLLAGQLHDINDWVPLDSLSQYATARPTDGSVISTSLEGTTTDGRVIPVALSPGSVGVSRAELESQGTRTIADPSLLGAVVASRRALHPDAEPLRAVTVWVATRRGSGLAQWLGQFPQFFVVVQWAVLLCEFLAPVALQLRGRLPWVALGAVALFHLCTYLTLGIHFLPTVVCWTAFLPLEKLAGRRSTQRSAVAGPTSEVHV